MNRVSDNTGSDDGRLRVSRFLDAVAVGDGLRAHLGRRQIDRRGLTTIGRGGRPRNGVESVGHEILESFNVRTAFRSLYHFAGRLRERLARPARSASEAKSASSSGRSATIRRAAPAAQGSRGIVRKADVVIRRERRGDAGRAGERQRDAGAAPRIVQRGVEAPLAQAQFPAAAGTAWAATAS